MPQINWTNPSVLRFADGRDPVAAIEEAAREQVLRAMDAGWKGPPFNPIGLADLRGIPVEASGDVRDARTVPSGDSMRIQFNPSQPRERLRFSIAHEVAHTLFEDVADRIRHRGGDGSRDDWQLEMLCNIAAAEFIMPVGSLEPGARVQPIEQLMAERRAFDVSAEAFILRVVKLVAEPAAAAFASASGDDPAHFMIDYSVPSRGWSGSLPAGSLPSETILGACAAVGQTLRGEETWPGLGRVAIECVGLPAYPGRLRPRVACVVRRQVDAGRPELSRLEYRHGNVLDAPGRGERIVVMLVNDRARRWGGGVAREAARRFPGAEDQFGAWLAAIPPRRRLGEVYLTPARDGVTLASLVGQEGYGASNAPRIRYAALATGLACVAAAATQRSASVHMPRLGSGASGGEWRVVEQLVSDLLVARGVSTAVYDLPPRRLQADADLFG